MDLEILYTKGEMGDASNEKDMCSGYFSFGRSSSIQDYAG